MTLAQPYVGITGIVTDDDVSIARECAALLRDHAPTHRLMAGVLVSAKTLRSEPTESRRYPPIVRVPRLLAGLADAECWPVVHYNTRAVNVDLMMELHDLTVACPAMRGLQLNVASPLPLIVSEYALRTPQVEVILQVNRAAMPSFVSLDTDGTHDLYACHVALCPTADEVQGYVNRYSHIRHVLLDASGGTGAGLRVDLAGTMIGRHGDYCAARGLRVGFAGGFGPDCAGVLASLAARLQATARQTGHEASLGDLSYDAESGVRVPVADPTPSAKHQDRLDRAKALAYVDAVAKALAGVV